MLPHKIPCRYQKAAAMPAVSCSKHFRDIMVLLIKPFHMQPRAEMRQPDILKVSPWQPCLEASTQQGGALERACLL